MDEVLMPKARLTIRRAVHDGMPQDFGRVRVRAFGETVQALTQRHGTLVEQAVIVSRRREGDGWRFEVQGGDVWLVTPRCNCGG